MKAMEEDKEDDDKKDETRRKMEEGERGCRWLSLASSYYSRHIITMPFNMLHSSYFAYTAHQTIGQGLLTNS